LAKIDLPGIRRKWGKSLLEGEREYEEKRSGRSPPIKGLHSKEWEGGRRERPPRKETMSGGKRKSERFGVSGVI